MKVTATEWRSPDWNSSQSRKSVSGLSRPALARLYYRSLPDVERALKRYPRGMWTWSPRPGKDWCIHEVLWHLADAEANVFIRIRKAAAEPGSAVVSWDQEKWAHAQDYRRMNPRSALALWKTLRRANVDFVKRLPAAAWKRKVRHPENGTISLEWNIAMNLWHTWNHLRQMEKRYLGWRSRG